MKVPLFDATRLDPGLHERLGEAVQQVLSGGAFIQGPEVRAFERELARWVGVSHAVGVASGTDALWLALRAAGVGPGDVVLTSAFTFFATASAICNTGATPAFADIDPVTYNLDAVAVAAALAGDSPALRRVGVDPARIRAVVAVHLYGQAADVAALRTLTDEAGIALVEDAAQALGATWEDRQAGTWGATGCFSFFPTKNLGGAGDGGAVTTGDDGTAARLRALGAHGSTRRYHHDLVGTNSRLDTIQAAILRAKLPHVDDWINRRRAHAEAYRQGLAELEGLVLPTEHPRARHTFNQYTVRVPGGRRDVVAEALAGDGIGTAVYYPVPVHLQPALRSVGYVPGDFPATEQAATEVLSLPVYPHLGEDEQQHVIGALRRHWKP